MAMVSIPCHIWTLLYFLSPTSGFLSTNTLINARQRFFSIYEERGENNDDFGFPPRPTTDLKKKTDLYSTDELQNLLGLHKKLVATEPGFLGKKNAGTDLTKGDDTISTEQSLLSLHELVVASTSSEPPTQDWKQAQYKSSLSLGDIQSLTIKAIAADVDGTLLSPVSHSLHPITERAITNAIEASSSPIHPLQAFFPATGKTRKGALRSLNIPLLEQMPGVFIQGLYCVDTTGRVVYEQRLPSEVIGPAEALARTHQVDCLLGYDGDQLWATVGSNDTLLEEVESKYGEPRPMVVDTALALHPAGFHKLLYMHDDTEWLTMTFRPQLENLAKELGDCVVTQAIPNMLELLPAGCSKAVGVRQLCTAMGWDLETEVCAMGDAENDLDLLAEAAVGVAVGNAADTVKTVADIVMQDTSCRGGAGKAIELFGLGKVL